MCIRDSPKVLVIDEMGYLPLDELGATIFFQLVSARYERGSILLTSNKRQPVSTPLPDQAALTVLASAPWLAGLYGVRSCQQRQSTRIHALARMRTACG